MTDIRTAAQRGWDQIGAEIKQQFSNSSDTAVPRFREIQFDVWLDEMEKRAITRVTPTREQIVQAMIATNKEYLDHPPSEDEWARYERDADAVLALMQALAEV